MTNTEHFYAWEDPFYPFKGKKETAIPKPQDKSSLINTKIDKEIFELMINRNSEKLAALNDELERL